MDKMQSLINWDLYCHLQTADLKCELPFTFFSTYDDVITGRKSDVIKGESSGFDHFRTSRVGNFGTRQERNQTVQGKVELIFYFSEITTSERFDLSRSRYLERASHKIINCERESKRWGGVS